MCKQFRLLLSLCFSALVLAQSQPPDLVVRNAASNSATVAPGYYVALTLTISPFFDPTQFSAELAVANQLYDVTLRAAPVTSRVWALIPIGAPTGQAQLTLIQNGVRLATGSFEIASMAPALFTKDYSSAGPARAVHYSLSQAAVNSLTSAAVPDHYVALFGAGLNGAPLKDVTVDVAGQSIPAVYAGSQGNAGLDQINFLLPKDAYQGCYVPVAIRVRGVVSNTATLSINNDTRACAHPLGLSYSDLMTLDNGGTIPLASISLGRSNSPGVGASEFANLVFIDADAATVALQAGVQIPDPQNFTCVSSTLSGALGARVAPGADAGIVKLTGPGGKQVEIPAPYFRGATFPTDRFLTPGLWEIAGSGGATLLSFAQTFTLPPAIESINIAPNSVVSADRELEITWDPSGFSPSDLVTIATSGLRCGTYAFTGRITMPKPIAFPTPQSITVSVSRFPTARTQFTILRRTGESVRAFITYSSFYSVPITVR